MIQNLLIIENLLVVSINRREQLDILKYLLSNNRIDRSYVGTVQFIYNQIENMNIEEYKDYQKAIKERVRWKQRD